MHMMAIAFNGGPPKLQDGAQGRPAAYQRYQQPEAERAGLLREAAALAGEEMQLEVRHAELGREAKALSAQAAAREALEEAGAREEAELLGRRAALGEREDEVLAMAAAEAGLLHEFCEL